MTRPIRLATNKFLVDIGYGKGHTAHVTFPRAEAATLVARDLSQLHHTSCRAEPHLSKNNADFTPCTEERRFFNKLGSHTATTPALIEILPPLVTDERALAPIVK